MGVNEGTVSFQLKDGTTPIGTAVPSGIVAGGLASASYGIPAGQTVKDYIIEATFKGVARSLRDAVVRFNAEGLAVLVDRPHGHRGGPANLNRCDEWSFCLTAARMAAEQERR